MSSPPLIRVFERTLFVLLYIYIMNFKLVPAYFYFFSLLLPVWLSAQTTGTYVVADRTQHVRSCQDSLITLANIISRTGILDINDPNDNVSQYKMFKLNGSVITTEEVTLGA